MRTFAANSKLRDTPIGKIPVDWQCVPLGELTQKPQYGTSVLSNSEGKHRVLRMNNIQDGRVTDNDIGYSDLSEREMRALELHPGDILINRTNSYDLVGKCGLFSLKGYYAFASYLVRLKPITKLIVPEFLNQFLQSEAADRVVKQLRTKGVSQSNINPTALVSTLHVPLPTTAEQSKIAQVLGRWDESILTFDHLKSTKNERKRGLMQQLLTGKRRFKEFGKKPWTRASLDSLLRPEDRYATFDDDKIYRLASIRRRSGGVFPREDLHGRDIKTKVLKKIHTGDFVISRMQVVHGALGTVPERCDGFYVSDSYDVFVCRDPSRLDASFLNFLSQCPEMYRLALISSHGVHIEKMTFVRKDFLRETVLVPPTIEEQRRIATVLEECDRDISLLADEIEALRKQKDGLMQKLLTGKIRLGT